jgi:hypothetical protein
MSGSGSEQTVLAPDTGVLDNLISNCRHGAVQGKLGAVLGIVADLIVVVSRARWPPTASL